MSVKESENYYKNKYEQLLKKQKKISNNKKAKSNWKKPRKSKLQSILKIKDSEEKQQKYEKHIKK